MSKLSKKDRFAQFLENRRLSQNDVWEELDNQLSLQITNVEKELHFPIFGDYPLMKFLQQYDDLILIFQEEKRKSRG